MSDPCTSTHGKATSFTGPELPSYTSTERSARTTHLRGGFAPTAPPSRECAGEPSKSRTHAVAGDPALLGRVCRRRTAVAALYVLRRLLLPAAPVLSSVLLRPGRMAAGERPRRSAHLSDQP